MLLIANKSLFVFVAFSPEFETLLQQDKINEHGIKEGTILF